MWHWGSAEHRIGQASGFWGDERRMKSRQQPLSERWSPAGRCRRLCSPPRRVPPVSTDFPMPGASGDPHLPGPTGTGMLTKG